MKASISNEKTDVAAVSAGKKDDTNQSFSDCDSKENDCSMKDIFGTEDCMEVNRDHPPNIKTGSPILDICFHPKSDLFATGAIDGECIMYRYSSEKVEEAGKFTHHQDSCRQIRFSSDGNVLYTISKDQSMAAVDPEKSAVIFHTKDAHNSPIYSFFEISKNLCATGDDDGTVKLWDLRKRESVFDFKCGEQTVTSLIACESGKYLSATVADGSLTGINIKKHRIEAQSEMFSSEFTCQAFVTRQSRLAVCSGSGAIYLFKWGDFGYKTDSLSGHPDLIQCCTAINDNIIITGCEDGNIRAVHLYGHKILGVIGQHQDFGVESLAVSHDGNLLASCSADEEIHFWNIAYVHKKTVGRKEKSKKKATVSRNLQSSRKRNPREFFKDIPTQMDSDDEGGPVPCTNPDYD